jgi:hypothetical protein
MERPTLEPDRGWTYDQGRPDVTVVLLDIMDAVGAEAGIRLLEDLEKDADWIDRKGTVQIVVFSQEATAQRHAVVARMKSFAVSGFLDKEEFFEATLNCLNTLRCSHSKAEVYRKWPTLADPVRRKCELVHSPNSTVMAQMGEPT